MGVLKGGIVVYIRLNGHGMVVGILHEISYEINEIKSQQAEVLSTRFEG